MRSWPNTELESWRELVYSSSVSRSLGSRFLQNWSEQSESIVICFNHGVFTCIVKESLVL